MQQNHRVRNVLIGLAILLVLSLCALGAYLLIKNLIPASAPAPTDTPVIPPVAPGPVTDCGPWTYADGSMTFAGNMSQDVCQIGEDLTAIRAGTPAHFVRTAEFTMAVCAASISNDDGDEWTYTDCGQNTGVTYPAGDYTVIQPSGYDNGGFRATNK